jgi:hypothetical protein
MGTKVAHQPCWSSLGGSLVPHPPKTGDGPRRTPVSNRHRDYPSPTKTDPCAPTIRGDVPHVDHVCKVHQPGVILSGGMQRYKKYGHLHGRRTVDIIVLFDTLSSDVMISTPRNVDKFEVALHAHRHPCRVAG